MADDHPDDKEDGLKLNIIIEQRSAWDDFCEGAGKSMRWVVRIVVGFMVLVAIWILSVFF